MYRLAWVYFEIGSHQDTGAVVPENSGSSLESNLPTILVGFVLVPRQESICPPLPILFPSGKRITRQDKHEIDDKLITHA